MTDTYVQRCLRQYKAHTKTREDGSKLVRCDGGLWDLFQGTVILESSRFRIVKVRQTGAVSLIQVGGLNLNPALRAQLIKECQGGTSS